MMTTPPTGNNMPSSLSAQSPKQNLHGMNLLEKIAELLPSLRRSDRKVGELVLHDPDFVISATMAALAKKAGVSDPTVVRFCTAVGCDGFLALKVELAQCHVLGVPATHSVINEADDLPVMVDKIMAYTLTSLDRMRRHLDYQAIEQAVDILSAAKRIEFFGFGASGIIAQDAQQKFPLFGVPCGAQVDAHQQYIMASLMEEGDVAVAISNTGETSAILDMTEAAQRNGAKIIAITGKRGKLFEQADVGLLAETLENTNLFTPTISRIAGLTMIDILATGTALRRGKACTDRLKIMKSQLQAMRSAVTQNGNKS